jgi:uncharacterized membrane protein
VTLRIPAWLERESEAWQRDGLISADQRRSILARYTATTDPQRAATVLVWLALLVAGFGVILLVGWNWDLIPDAVKIGATIGLTVILYAFAAGFAGRGPSHLRRAEGCAFAGALAAGASILAISDVYRVGMDDTSPAFMWAVAIACTAMLASSAITTALGAAVVAWWMLMAGGQPPPPWGFLLVWPCLAIAVEQQPNRYVAGALTLTFGAWAAFVAIDVWRYEALIGVCLLAAGAALDVWAHYPPARRPAFARSTPALVVTIAGLVVLAIAAIAVSPRTGWHQAATGEWPALALLGALAGVVVWPATGRRPVSWRAVFFAGLALVWIVLWRVLPDAAAASGAWRWGWLIALSAAFVVLTVSTVREAAAARDRGLFAVGLASVAALVIVHLVNSGGRVGRSALVLLSAAAVLWWISRMWIRRTSGPAS